jgi:ubiquinone/menaquinone biosynthesis C-methylase UbiE
MPDSSLDQVIGSLRAAGDSTRLRLLALVRDEGLAVSELVRVLGQSQPRVSRHLKLLAESGLVERQRDGAWVFYSLTAERDLGRRLIELVGEDDAVLAQDQLRLQTLRAERRARAEEYFRANAPDWDRRRALPIDPEPIERRLLESLVPHAPKILVDIGTGTGRMLELLGPHVGQAIGIDASRAMLDVARAKLEAAGLRQCRLRQGDMARLPLADESADLATLHQVLHFAERPAPVIAEAARILKPGGRLAVVDLAPHTMEELRAGHQHRRLGFARDTVEGWCRTAGLEPYETLLLPGDPLDVTIWLAAKLKYAKGSAP